MSARGANSDVHIYLSRTGSEEERRKNPPAHYLSSIGQRGGQRRTAPKKQAAKDNCAKARAAKALYRAQPGLRPEKG